MGTRRYKGAPNIILSLLHSTYGVSDVPEVSLDDLIYNATESLKESVVGKKYYPKGYAKLSIERLCGAGVMRKRKRNGKIICELTPKGKQKLIRLNLRNALDKEEHWDGKWRMIVFDIAETSRKERNLLRRELQYQGFKKIQNSVWVYPDECFEFVSLLKTSFELGNSVLYAIVEELEDDTALKKEFGLK